MPRVRARVYACTVCVHMCMHALCVRTCVRVCVATIRQLGHWLSDCKVSGLMPSCVFSAIVPLKFYFTLLQFSYTVAETWYYSNWEKLMSICPSFCGPGGTLHAQTITHVAALLWGVNTPPGFS